MLILRINFNLEIKASEYFKVHTREGKINNKTRTRNGTEQNGTNAASTVQLAHVGLASVVYCIRTKRKNTQI